MEQSAESANNGKILAADDKEKVLAAMRDGIAKTCSDMSDDKIFERSPSIKLMAEEIARKNMLRKLLRKKPVDWRDVLAEEALAPLTRILQSDDVAKITDGLVTLVRKWDVKSLTMREVLTQDGAKAALYAIGRGDRVEFYARVKDDNRAHAPLVSYPDDATATTPTTTFEKEKAPFVDGLDKGPKGHGIT